MLAKQAMQLATGLGNLPLLRTLLLAVTIVALTFPGTAHSVFMDDKSAGSEYSSYVLPDGSVPVLCLPGNDAGSSQHARNDHCPFCTLTKSILATPPPSTFVPVNLTGTKLGVPDLGMADAINPARTVFPRAPPTFSA